MSRPAFEVSTQACVRWMPVTTVTQAYLLVEPRERQLRDGADIALREGRQAGHHAGDLQVASTVLGHQSKRCSMQHNQGRMHCGADSATY